jgi:hypothetical protein
MWVLVLSYSFMGLLNLIRSIFCHLRCLRPVFVHIHQIPRCSKPLICIQNLCFALKISTFVLKTSPLYLNPLPSYSKPQHLCPNPHLLCSRHQLCTPFCAQKFTFLCSKLDRFVLKTLAFVRGLGAPNGS